MYGTPYVYNWKDMSSDTTAYQYGNDVIYSNGTYTLMNTISSSNWSTIYNGGLNSNHYTCFSTEVTCESVYYVYYTDSSKAYYLTLTGGKKIEVALSEMLDYNITSSTIKGDNTTVETLDNWYYTNIDQKGYSSYIEDTIWCNDRSIYQKNGFDPNKGSTRSDLSFSGYGRAINSTPSLTCSRDIDKFTVSILHGNGDLDYPVGLLTVDEAMFAGGATGLENSTYYLKSGVSYWMVSPFVFNIDKANKWVVYVGGRLRNYNVGGFLGVRPSISLAPGFTISEGNGSVTTPYIVITN